MALSENAAINKSEKKEVTKSNDKDKREKPVTKVIIRRLPPGIKQEDFLTQVSPIADYDYIYTVKGDKSLGENSFSRVYINFCNIEDLYIFKEKFDNYVFVDTKGHEYPAVVEYSSFQKVPKRKKARADPKIGSIESDPLYTEFLESLKEQPNQEEKPEYSYQPSNENKNDRTTPLLDYLKQRKVDRLRIREEKREERKKKDIDRKKFRDDDRKKYRDEDHKKYKDEDHRKQRDDDHRKYRDDEHRKYKDDDYKKYKDDNHKKYKDDDHKKYRDDDHKKYREDDRKKYAEDKNSLKNVVIKPSTSYNKEKEIKDNIKPDNVKVVDAEPDIKTNDEKKNDDIEKDNEKPSFKNRERKYEDKKINKAKGKYASRPDKFEDKRDFKNRRDDYREKDYHRNKYEDKKYETKEKEYPKKVKKYSERREERKIEAKKAEQKNVEKPEDEKFNTEEEMEDFKFLDTDYVKKSPDNKSSKSSEERYDDGDSESKHRNKENDPRMQRRIRNKDRPTMAIYKPGMLRKKSIDNDPRDFKDEIDASSAKEDD